MELSLERIREAAYWCNKLEEAGAIYYRLDRYLSKISTVSYNVMQYILNTAGFFIAGASILGIAIAAYTYPLFVRSSPAVFAGMADRQLIDLLYDGWIIHMLKYLPIALIILLPISVIYGVHSVKKHLKKTQIRCAKKKKELEEIVDTKMDLIKVIPEKYRYKLAANYIVEVFETGRASAMKEALDLYEEQLHRWNMEGKMQKLVNKQRRDSNAVWAYIITDGLFR